MESMSNFLKSPCSCYYFTRNFSTTMQLLKMKNAKAHRPIRYRTGMQEPANSERMPQQVLFNTGRKLIPFNKKFPITGKNTGPGVEGGSARAQRLAAVHKVQPTGYVNKYGVFVKVKPMVPEFIVPDLKDFPLKPYVPYSNVTNIQNRKHTAREIFDECIANSVKEEYFAAKKD